MRTKDFGKVYGEEIFIALKIPLMKCRVSRNKDQILNIPYRGKLLWAILCRVIITPQKLHHFSPRSYPIHNKVLNRII